MMMKITFDEHIPVFLQIIEYIKIQIITGEKKPGEKLLSVRDLARELEINPNTVQKAYQLLEAEGIIKGERGSGNYITEDDALIEKNKRQMSESITKQYIMKIKSYGISAEDIRKMIEQQLEVQK